MKYIIILLVLCVVGCSENSTGVSAGNESSSGNTVSVLINKVRSSGSEKASEVTIKIPAAVIISEALTPIVSTQSASARRFLDQTYLENQKTYNEISDFNEKFLVSTYKKDRDMFEKMTANFDVETIEALKNGDPVSVHNAFERMYHKFRFAACNAPLFGWEVSPMREKDRKKVDLYQLIIASHCEFTNDIFTEIASKLSGKVMSDPDSAKEIVRQEWNKIGSDTLNSVWDGIVSKNIKSQFSANLTGVKGVEFSGGGGKFHNDGGGFSIVKNGMPWYGNGALSGRVIEFSLRSTLSAKTEKTKSFTTESDSVSGGKTGSDVSVK